MRDNMDDISTGSMSMEPEATFVAAGNAMSSVSLAVSHFNGE